MTRHGLEDTFRTHERLLWGLSYRLTGSAADADDIVQETFLRALKHTRPLPADTWRPWLVRVATNLGVDTLRRRRRRVYVGSWLPSPIETEGTAPTVPAPPADGPAERYEQLESVSFAFLLALEALTPRQRAVLLLRDVFDYSPRETGKALGLTTANVRVTHHRARRAMRDYDRDRSVPTAAAQERTQQALATFVRCLVAQDVAGIEALLADEVRTVADGGGAYTALHAPVVGRHKVALLHLRVAKRRAPGARIEFRTMNGFPAVVIEYATATRRQAPRLALCCDVDREGRIRELHAVLAPRKLTAVRF